MNTRMSQKIKEGQAIDLKDKPREGDYYILGEKADPFNEDADDDYCDTSTSSWMWSIGRRRKDGRILASRSSDLYQNPDFECLWLR